MGAEDISWPALVQVLDLVNRGKFDVESGHIPVSGHRRGWDLRIIDIGVAVGQAQCGSSSGFVMPSNLLDRFADI